ncbi:MAG: SPFH domain-containing protein [Planctomycetota bacterium]|nr:SPFH domain-containing protein [Planctomycetota bacterium]
MTGIMLLIGIVLAIAIVSLGMRVPNNSVRIGAGVLALGVLFIFISLSSIRLVGENEIGVLVKNFGGNMAPGQIIATDGEKGPQAQILGPGWHFWYFPGLYDVEKSPVVWIKGDEVGLITTTDGLPLPSGQFFAPEWEQDEFGGMLDAEQFLTTSGGFKGPQAAVLPPGKWRINPRLYTVERVPVTNIEKATVGVVKSNVGNPPEDVAPGEGQIVEKGQRGIWRQPYTPQKLFLNTKAYEVTMISNKQQIIRYGIGGESEESEIEVRTSDGYTFPVDVRVEYQIRPLDAPLVVVELGDDGSQLRLRLASTVRAIFRNNAESIKALDYVNQRSQQESSSTKAIAEEMIKVGVSIIAVRIGSIAGDGSLSEILKTQTDRDLAKQEQETFQMQQLAAEQKKALTRTQQEAEEEKRLATARYEVQIEEQNNLKIIIAANAEAEAIKIKAEAQAEAYRVIALQIGPGNAALIELLQIVGERGINITPRVMVVGGNGGSDAKDAQTTALIGTMLDSMMAEKPAPSKPEN